MLNSRRPEFPSAAAVGEMLTEATGGRLGFRAGRAGQRQAEQQGRKAADGQRRDGTPAAGTARGVGGRRRAKGGRGIRRGGWLAEPAPPCAEQRHGSARLGSARLGSARLGYYTETPSQTKAAFRRQRRQPRGAPSPVPHSGLPLPEIHFPTLRFGSAANRIFIDSDASLAFHAWRPRAREHPRDYSSGLCVPDFAGEIHKNTASCADSVAIAVVGISRMEKPVAEVSPEAPTAEPGQIDSRLPRRWLQHTKTDRPPGIL